ncbi:M15 family metallopeptidase [Roseateles chitinivorans]|uniref:M15 family metallopeptidase n=1 Tax=Roseateles chitinivorans TaxID=2917965 RepID=UPI003D6714EE
MSLEESFRDRTFVVDDPDARIRRDDDLMAFVAAPGGGFRTIARGTSVSIVEVRLEEAGSKKRIVFGRAAAAGGGATLGWTSTRNLAGSFMNETIGRVPPEPGATRFGPNAAWADGQFLEQLDLVAIVDSTLEIERLAMKTIAPFAALVAAAKDDGVRITLNSGFRSYPEQKLLHDGFVRGLPGFNTAAKPGFSKHQNGIAFDLSVAGGDGNPTYEWLKRRATSFGFVRTVSKEPWHWEFDEPKAQAARAGGTFRTPNVRD